MMGLRCAIANWKGKRLIRKALDRELLKTTFTEQWITLPEGRRVYAHVHSPVKEGKYPCAVFVPGGGSPGTDYDELSEITADDVAALGFAAVHYDPAGRGRSEGEEDHWGRVHQKELSDVLRHVSGLPLVDEGRLCIISFSLGIAIASGALARYPTPPIKFLYDWEGPSNRFNITLNDTHEYLRDFPTSNDAFWREREPARFIGDITCGYFRYQADEDHVQGSYKGHAIELINLATAGRAAWTRCSDNPLNTVFDESDAGRYQWVAERENNKAQILKYLLELLD